MSISIFAKPPSRAQGDHHLQRVSSIIRGSQIAHHLKARLNPTEGYDDDVCIYVKPHVKPHEDFEFKGHPYLDIIDGWILLHLARKHPEVTLITCSYPDFEYVSAQVDNKVLLIPQHHANFERIRHTPTEVKRIGVIGTKPAFAFLPETLKDDLEKRGIELVLFSTFQNRTDIVNFYKTIDLQIVWRPYMKSQKIPLSNPLKLVNGASLGVPTIALSEPAFTEMAGCYFPVETYNELIAHVDTLQKNPSLLTEYSKRCFEKAEVYHIDKIGKSYKDLI